VGGKGRGGRKGGEMTQTLYVPMNIIKKEKRRRAFLSFSYCLGDILV
jgi:hypothetical protein